MTRLNLQGLEAFAAAARHLRFAEAAAELGLTPSAISQRIKALEEALGQPLFLRQHRRVALTPTGEQLARTAATAFRLLRDGVTAAQPQADEAVAVSAVQSLASRWLAPRLPAFTARHPAIAVRIDIADRLADLAAGEADLALRLGRGNYPGLSVARLLPVEVFPVASPALAARIAAPADLAHQPLLHDLYATPALNPPDWPRWFALAGLPPRRRRNGAAADLTFGSSVMAIAAAVAGQGVALANPVLAADELADGRLVRPFGGEHVIADADWAYWLVTHRRTARRPAVTAFRRWLLAEAAATVWAA